MRLLSLRSRCAPASILGLCIFLIFGCSGSAGAAEDVLKGVSGGIGFENGGSASLGPHKRTGQLLFDDKMGLGEKIDLNAEIDSDFNEVYGFSLDYKQPLSDKIDFKFGTITGNLSHPSGLTSTGMSEKSVDFGLAAALAYTHIVSDTLATQFELGFRTTDARTRQTPAVAGAGSTYHQNFRDVAAAAAVELDPTKDTKLFSKITFSQGVGLLKPAHFRGGADDTPLVVSLNGELTHNLSSTWQIVLSGDAQWTPDRLNDLKTFSLGGWDYAAAYGAGESKGDIGGGGRAELNFVGEAKLADKLTLVYKPFVFVDGGFTKILKPDSTETGRTIGKASAGLGLAVETTHLHGSVQVAYPLTGRSSLNNKRRPRLLFSLGLKG